MSTLSVVVPCYNEADGIGQLRAKLLPVLERLGVRHSVELILVDDGSTDATAELLEKEFGACSMARVVRHERNMNLGAAIRTGVRESKGEWIANLDSDCTYDPAILESLLMEMEKGADLVSASPYHPRGEVVGVPGYRLLLSKGLSMIYRVMLGTRVYTYTAMVRAYRREIYPAISSERNDFAAVAEMMLKALKQKRDVREIPATLSVRQYGESKMKIMKVIRTHLHLMKKLLFNPSFFLCKNS